MIQKQFLTVTCRLSVCNLLDHLARITYMECQLMDIPRRIQWQGYDIVLSVLGYLHLPRLLPFNNEILTSDPQRRDGHCIHPYFPISQSPVLYYIFT